MVSPAYTGTPKRMSMYSRLARAFSEISLTLWLTTNITGRRQDRRGAVELAQRRFLRNGWWSSRNGNAVTSPVTVLPTLCRRTAPIPKSSRNCRSSCGSCHALLPVLARNPAG